METNVWERKKLRFRGEDFTVFELNGKIKWMFPTTETEAILTAMEAILKSDNFTYISK